MSSGVLAISLADNPKPKKNRQLATMEQAQGPYLSMTLPTMAAKGYWPIIPLRRESAFIYVFSERRLRQSYGRYLRLRELQVSNQRRGDEGERVDGCTK